MLFLQLLCRKCFPKRGTGERTRQDSGPQGRKRLAMNRLKSEEGEVHTHSTGNSGNSISAIERIA